ncbi:unnamed protein product [Zymoseptoria tritici ST99CH_1A5]|uniref:Fe2OG dioxygenase domain-containing protein n=1 Tax=Zymoseptoria tritici ST99CH_1A5 TaxID=1276529 RepID=A0A1Y6LCK1_ZYMTR|nr:unnamed protein product [Zymoseptoria tritici ST99CH_3D1]SMY21060.1 unnamed protein product [Zymoseptoria tritici ST99CH_1A5]
MALERRDLLCFTDGNDEQRKRFAMDLVEDYRRTGFAVLINHGITDEEIVQLFELSKAFFALPEGVKNSIAHVAGPDPQRGWSRVGAENAARLFAKEFGSGALSKNASDCREHFDMGAPNDAKFPNRWLDPGYIANFRPVMEEHFERFAEVTIKVLEALELGLDVPFGSLSRRLYNTASEFRLLHYPATDVEVLKNGSTKRIWPHFDLGVITLLFQDMCGGLEIEDRATSNAFVPVLPETSREMVTNISETLQRWTNNELSAGLHQVSIPPHLKDVEAGRVSDRYSIAFFCKADRESSVGPLPHFLSPSRPALYKAMSAIEYHQQRLKAAYED